MRNKGIYQRLLAGALSLILLAGCGSENSRSDDTSSEIGTFTETSRGSETVTEKATEPVRVTEPPETVTEASLTETTPAETEPPEDVVRYDLGLPSDIRVSYEGNDALVSWDPVEGANCYEVSLDEQTLTVEECSCIIYGIEDTESYSVGVTPMLVENGKTVAQSLFAATCSFRRKASQPEQPVITDNDATELRRIEWRSYDNKYNWWTNVTISVKEYEYLSSLPRYCDPIDYQNYIDETYNKASLKNIAKAIKDVADENGYTLDETAYEVIRFVQSIPYKTDIESKGVEEYPKYPVETIFDNCGDCEDLSILLAGLLRELGIGCCFIDYPTHIAVAVKASDSSTDYNFEAFGNRYFYVETTYLGWKVGEIPDDFVGKNARLIRVI